MPMPHCPCSFCTYLIMILCGCGLCSFCTWWCFYAAIIFLLYHDFAGVWPKQLLYLCIMRLCGCVAMQLLYLYIMWLCSCVAMQLLYLCIMRLCGFVVHAAFVFDNASMQLCGLWSFCIFSSNVFKQLCGRVEWFSTFLVFRKATHFCWSGIFLGGQFQQIGKFRCAGQSFYFQKFAGTLIMNIFLICRILPNTPKNAKQKIRN